MHVRRSAGLLLALALGLTLGAGDARAQSYPFLFKFGLGQGATNERFDLPQGVTVAPSGNIIVANAASGTVSVIDTATNAVVGSVGVGNFPIGVAITPDGSTRRTSPTATTPCR